MQEPLASYLGKSVGNSVLLNVEETIIVMVNCKNKNAYISKLLELSDSTQKTMMGIIQRRSDCSVDTKQVGAARPRKNAWRFGDRQIRFVQSARGHPRKKIRLSTPAPSETIYMRRAHLDIMQDRIVQLERDLIEARSEVGQL